MSKEPSIFIIGAGAAGIAAAARLMENGQKNVKILEASERVGGRIHTVDFADNVIELGAEWIHGEKGNIVFELASPHDLLVSSLAYGDSSRHRFVNVGGKMMSVDDTTEILELYYSISHDAENAVHEKNSSHGDYFTKQFYKALEKNRFLSNDKAEQILDWMEKFDNSIQCSDTWYDVSARGLTTYWECEGDNTIAWKKYGYKIVLNLLTKRFPNVDDYLPVYENILYNKEVSEINYLYESNIAISTSDGSKYTASHVIWTPSLGVLKEQHKSLFCPLLPVKKQLAIQGLSIGVANKMFLEFEQQWWPEDVSCFSFLWTKEDKEDLLRTRGAESLWLCDVFSFHVVDNQPRILCGWVYGPSAKLMETLSEDTLLGELYFLLTKFLENIYEVPAPCKLIRSTWYTNKYFKGSYSFNSMKSENMDVHAKDLAEPIYDVDDKPIVLFAGEATHDHFYSTVHGAIETGFREADRLLNYYKK